MEGRKDGRKEGRKEGRMEGRKKAGRQEGRKGVKNGGDCSGLSGWFKIHLFYHVPSSVCLQYKTVGMFQYKIPYFSTKY